jgi:hypothetical protein
MRRTGAVATLPGSLAAPLHVGPDELLGVLHEHLVDLVEYRGGGVGELSRNRFPTPRNMVSVAELALDLTGLACGFAGFIGDAPVLTGAAGTASR